MKLEKELNVKEKLSVSEYLRFVNGLVDINFNGTEYRPDYATIYTNAIIADNCIDGVEIEEITLDVAEEIEANEDLIEKVKKVKDTDYYRNAVYDSSARVEFAKQMAVSNNSAIEMKLMEILEKEADKLEQEIKTNDYAEKLVKVQTEQIEYANKVQEQFSPEEQAEITRKMADSDFDMNKVADIISEKYFSSTKHDEKLQEVVDAKNKEITKYKAAHDEQNVLSGKKK